MPTITVWIHGTAVTPRHIPLATVRNFFACPLGLNHWQTFPTTYHHRAIGEHLTTGDPERFNPEHLYFFGWSGDLSFEARQQAAQELYVQLTALMHRVTEQCGNRPQLRIISHSHGGNVALNLAYAKPASDTTLSIDELILLACPVQMATLVYVRDPLFKKIYSLYSMFDMIQVLDMQGLYNNNIKAPLFSRRRFPAHERLVQAQISFDNGRSLAHIEFLLKPFLISLGTTLDIATAWFDNQLNASGKEIIRRIAIASKRT